MNEITVCTHSPVKLLLLSCFTAASCLGWLYRRTRGVYNALSGTSPSSLSLPSRLIKRACAFALLQPPFRVRWWRDTGDNSLRNPLLPNSFDRRLRCGLPIDRGRHRNMTRADRGQHRRWVTLQTVDQRCRKSVQSV